MPCLPPVGCQTNYTCFVALPRLSCSQVGTPGCCRGGTRQGLRAWPRAAAHWQRCVVFSLRCQCLCASSTAHTTLPWPFARFSTSASAIASWLTPNHQSSDSPTDGPRAGLAATSRICSSGASSGGVGDVAHHHGRTDASCRFTTAGGSSMAGGHVGPHPRQECGCDCSVSSAMHR